MISTEDAVALVDAIDTEPAALITVEVTANESESAVPEPTLKVDAVPAPLAIALPLKVICAATSANSFVRAVTELRIAWRWSVFNVESCA